MTGQYSMLTGIQKLDMDIEKNLVVTLRYMTGVLGAFCRQ